jgi:hypothetical protein
MMNFKGEHMNLIVVLRLARHYKRSGMSLKTALSQAWKNQQQSNKYGVRK